MQFAGRADERNVRMEQVSAVAILNIRFVRSHRVPGLSSGYGLVRPFPKDEALRRAHLYLASADRRSSCPVIGSSARDQPTSSI